MSTADEIELKFLADPKDVEAVLAAAPQGEDREKELVSTYYDTPAGDLRQAGVSLRIRRHGEQRIQTLKRGDGFAREEHEVEVPGDRLDLSMAALHECLTVDKHADLAPMFTVRVHRRQRTFQHQGAAIEMAVDQGEVLAGDRRRPISEVELELKDGPCSGLFDIARLLSKTAPLYLSFEGKASQGRHLQEGSEKAPRRYVRVKLKRKMTTGQAFQAVARAAVGQISANGQLLRDSGGSEALKQLRVAVRRLRSAFSTFGVVVADGRLDDLRAELKWLGSACNEARDLDVFANDNAELVEQRAAGGKTLGSAVGAARKKAHAKAAAAVGSGRFRNLVLELTAWIETGDWLSDPDRESLRDKPAIEFARDALTRRRRKLKRQGGDLASLDDEGRHRVRISAKKLRYAAEAFATLFDEERTRRYVKRIKQLQDELGAMNDAAVARDLVLRLDPDGEPAGDAPAVQDRRQLKSAQQAMDRVIEAKRYWRSA